MRQSISGGADSAWPQEVQTGEMRRGMCARVCMCVCMCVSVWGFKCSKLCATEWAWWTITLGSFSFLPHMFNCACYTLTWHTHISYYNRTTLSSSKRKKEFDDVGLINLCITVFTNCWMMKTDVRSEPILTLVWQDAIRRRGFKRLKKNCSNNHTFHIVTDLQK